jgi:hypothetical protein
MNVRLFAIAGSAYTAPQKIETLKGPAVYAPRPKSSTATSGFAEIRSVRSKTLRKQITVQIVDGAERI